MHHHDHGARRTPKRPFLSYGMREKALLVRFKFHVIIASERFIIGLDFARLKFRDALSLRLRLTRRESGRPGKGARRTWPRFLLVIHCLGRTVNDRKKTERRKLKTSLGLNNFARCKESIFAPSPLVAPFSLRAVFSCFPWESYVGSRTPMMGTSETKPSVRNVNKTIYFSNLKK